MYFASADSLGMPRKAHKSAETQELEPTTFRKHVDNPLWSMIKQTPEPVMMTYQISPRYQTRNIAPSLFLWIPGSRSFLWETWHPEHLFPQEKEIALPGSHAEVVLIKINVSLHCQRWGRWLQVTVQSVRLHGQQYSDFNTIKTILW